MSLELLLPSSSINLLSAHTSVGGERGGQHSSPQRVEALEKRGGRETVERDKHEVSVFSAGQQVDPDAVADSKPPESAQLGESELEFSQDEETGRTIIKVYDRESGELIRQIPPEDIQTFLQRLAQEGGSVVSKRL